MNEDGSMLFLAGVFFGALLFLLLLWISQPLTRTEVIEAGCGQYNSVTGDFEFIEQDQ